MVIKLSDVLAKFVPSIHSSRSPTLEISLIRKGTARRGHNFAKKRFLFIFIIILIIVIVFILLL